MNYKYIAIEGNIGAGKTSLANLLAKDFGSGLILENFKDNPFLQKFYQEPEQYAFQLELSFLTDRYQQLKQFFPPKSPITISDFYFSKSLLFAKANLKEQEYLLYAQLFDIIYEKLPKPDLIIYLHANIEKLLGNIKERGRDFEKEISFNYLEKIENIYFSYFSAHLNFPVLIIDINNIDFVKQVNDYQLFKDLLKNDFSNGFHTILLK
jgi:deoxyguanosine kinase